MLIYAPLIAIFSLTWCWLLTENGMIFDKLFIFLRDKLEEKYEWLYKPLIGCPMCNAGQVAFWFYLLMNNDYLWYDHIFFTTLTIFAANMLMKLYFILYEGSKKN